MREALLKFRDDHGHEVDFTAPYAVAPIRRTRPLAVDEFVFLRDVSRVMPKITLPAPSTMHLLRLSDFADPRVYANVDRFFDDLVLVFRQEIADLVAAGCRYVQIDEIAIALLCDPAISGPVLQVPVSTRAELVDRYIAALNGCVSDCPPEVYVGIHMCRGNFKGHYLSEGGYESVAEQFFTQTNTNHFLLEYDTPRAGDFAPLRFVPTNKGVVLGLVSSKSLIGIVDTLRRRVEEAAEAHRPRPVGDQSAMRLRQHRRWQPGRRGGAVGEIPRPDRGRERGLGVAFGRFDRFHTCAGWPVGLTPAPAAPIALAAVVVLLPPAIRPAAVNLARIVGVFFIADAGTSPWAPHRHALRGA